MASGVNPLRQLVLLGITAAVSFLLGLTVGRNTAPKPESTLVRVRVPVESASKDQLTFYKTLPSGSAPPLGSGINRETAATQPPPPAPSPVVASPPPPPPSRVEVEEAVEAEEPVKIAPERKSAAPPPPDKSAKAAAKGAWRLQAAATAEEKSARTLGKRLQSRGYQVAIEPAEVKGKTWYRVYVGPFNSQEGAKSAAAQLQKSEKISPLVQKL